MGFIEVLLQMLGLSKPSVVKQKPTQERTPPPPPRQPKPAPSPYPAPQPELAPLPTDTTPATPPPPPPPPPMPPKPQEERLSEHFTLAEMCASDTAMRCRIDNTPPAEIVERMRATAAGMERVRTILGGAAIRINSCYRCSTLNTKIGSTDKSAHTQGYAVDFIAPGFGAPYDIAKRLAASDLMPEVDQLIHEFGTWVHISFDPRRRKQAFTLHYVQGKKGVFTTGGIVPLMPNGCPAKEMA